ncbi:MAG: S1 RNA-binding domain-containing protein, partial [Firmicutes bacterium]|nr:S1 RNA-binding domain-containing protein [Bacillota bacterium]
VSIARRLQDPLAELVKIEPRSLGVGQYQHDVNPKRLDEHLAGVVEDVVNQVGVDLNTASVQLLAYVAGLTPRVAENVVARRESEGPFTSRKELLEVPRLGPRTFEQCAGFLQIPDAPHPLDRTPIHPESYQAAEGLLKELGLSLAEVGKSATEALDELSPQDIAGLAKGLGCGEPTLFDIVEALKRPGRDPREDLPPPILRSDVVGIDDLTEGMVLSGTVRNVVDFGAFIDIGVTQDGLVHVSELADRFVRHPLDVVAVGDTVRVRVLRVDKERNRIALSMKGL